MKPWKYMTTDEKNEVIHDLACLGLIVGMFLILFIEIVICF